MIAIHKNSDTVILLVHEIYGINRHMETMCTQLSQLGYAVVCPNLLERDDPFTYAEEAAAYRYFMDEVGFPKATARIREAVAACKSRYDFVWIVGFSVGATIAWLCSEDANVDGIIGYYGSRIRNCLDRTPQCPALLFFPQEEQSCNVDELIAALHSKEIVIHQLAGQHGFGDPFSPKYQEDSAKRAFRMMAQFLRSNVPGIV